MSDATLRKLERTYRDSGALGDGLAWAREATRAGEVSSGLDEFDAFYFLSPNDKNALEQVVKKDRFAIEFQPKDNPNAVRLYNVPTRISGDGNLENRTYDLALFLGSDDSTDEQKSILKKFECISLHEYHACTEALRQSDENGTVSKSLIDQVKDMFLSDLDQVKDMFLSDLKSTMGSSTFISYDGFGSSMIAHAHLRGAYWFAQGNYGGYDGFVDPRANVIKDVFGAIDGCDVGSTYSWLADRDVRFMVVRRINDGPGDDRVWRMIASLKGESLYLFMFPQVPCDMRGIQVKGTQNRPFSEVLAQAHGFD
jgi:hypothetical protein